MYAKNQEYLEEFMRWHELEGSSAAHKNKSKTLSTIFLRDYVKEMDFKELSEKEMGDIWLEITKRYTNPFSLTSYAKTLRQFIRIIFKLGKGGQLPSKYDSIKPSKSKHVNNRIYSNLKLNKSVKEVFAAVRKANNIRDKFILIMLFDLGLRPQELLRGTVGDFEKNDLGYWYYNVDPSTKTGFRKPRCILSIPYIEQYLEILPKDKETPLINIGLRALELLTKKHLERNPYVLRRSGITFYYIIFKGNERLLKQRFGTTQFNHYVKMFGTEVDDLIDKELGKNENNDNELKQLQPKYCINCGFNTDYDKSNCRVCKNSLDINEQQKREIMDKVAYKSAESLYKIDPEEFEKIANSFGMEVK
jgi:integrase